MSHGFSIILDPIWRAWDGRIFRLVNRLHRALPPAEPPVTLHGRALDPVAEGFGAQYQLTLNDDLYGGRYRAAYFVVQVRLLQQPPAGGANGDGSPIVWRVDTLTALEPAARTGQVERFAQRSHEVPLDDSDRLAALFGPPMRLEAAEFFRRVRAGERPAD